MSPLAFSTNDLALATKILSVETDDPGLVGNYQLTLSVYYDAYSSSSTPAAIKFDKNF